MKRQSLTPRDDLILDLFIHDTIDRSADAIRLCNVINSVEGSYSIAINGAWGSGKTVYIKQAKILLDYLNGTLSSEPLLSEQIDFFIGATPHFNELLQKKNNVKTIYYDAWENDNDIDPVLSIIFSIINSGQFSLKEKPTHDIGSILSSIAEIISGRNVTAFFQAAKGENFLSGIKQQKSVRELTNDFFQNMIRSGEERIAIFIDELDRCKPTYAITLLERIKHYFDNENLVFIFSINLDQLQHTVKSYYGIEFDACRYLDKFFDLVIQLPPYNNEKFLNNIGFKESAYISRKVSRAVIKSLNLQMREQEKFIQFDLVIQLPPYNNEKFLNNIGFKESAYISRKVSRAVIKSLNLQMREQEKFIQLVKISGLERLTQKISTSFSDDRAYFFAMAYVLPLILGLQIVNIKDYNDFINGTNFAPLVSLLNNLDVRMLDRSGLLNENETFLSSRDNKSGLKQVAVNEVASSLSRILFRNNYELEYQQTIGSMTFSKEVRNELLRNACLLSKYTEYE